MNTVNYISTNYNDYVVEADNIDDAVITIAPDFVEDEVIETYYIFEEDDFDFDFDDEDVTIKGEAFVEVEVYHCYADYGVGHVFYEDTEKLPTLEEQHKLLEKFAKQCCDEVYRLHRKHDFHGDAEGIAELNQLALS